jgi:pimeloyl-ACP methyl ester carboxylesterase
VNKLVLASTPYKRDSMQPGFFQGLQAMFDRDRNRMLAFQDFSDSGLRAIAAPVLILDGDADVVRPEHALALLHLVPHGQLAILPGGHGEYLGEICARKQKQQNPGPRDNFY